MAASAAAAVLHRRGARTRREALAATRDGASGSAAAVVMPRTVPAGVGLAHVNSPCRPSQPSVSPISAYSAACRVMAGGSGCAGLPEAGEHARRLGAVVVGQRAED